VLAPDVDDLAKAIRRLHPVLLSATEGRPRVPHHDGLDDPLVFLHRWSLLAIVTAAIDPPVTIRLRAVFGMESFEAWRFDGVEDYGVEGRVELQEPLELHGPGLTHRREFPIYPNHPGIEALPFTR
jgi:hypothetical protein